MILVKVHCSDCLEENELVAEDLDEVDREVCECGYNYVVLSVAAFSPVYAERGELVRLPPRRRLAQAA
jgi:hypothetical protein